MDDRRADSTPTILRRLGTNVVALLQTYAVLAGQEARATVKDVVTGLLFLAASALLAVLALTMVIVTLVLLLSLWLRPWEAAAIVFALTGLAMVVFIELGIGRLRRGRLKKVGQALKEDLAWLRRELRESD